MEEQSIKVKIEDAKIVVEDSKVEKDVKIEEKEEVENG
jgi:hypothetical protein